MARVSFEMQRIREEDGPRFGHICRRCWRRSGRRERSVRCKEGREEKTYSASFSLLFDSEPKEPSSDERSCIACPAAVEGERKSVDGD